MPFDLLSPEFIAAVYTTAGTHQALYIAMVLDRNQHEREEAQKAAMKDMLARTEKMEPEERAAAREQICRATEENIRDQQEQMKREQEDRGLGQQNVRER